MCVCVFVCSWAGVQVVVQREHARESATERGNGNSLKKKIWIKADSIVDWLSFDLLQLFLNSDWNRSIYLWWIICKNGHQQFLPSLYMYTPPSFKKWSLFSSVLESGWVLCLALTSRLCASDAGGLLGIGLKRFAASIFSLLDISHHKEFQLSGQKKSMGREKRTLESEKLCRQGERPSQSPVILATPAERQLCAEAIVDPPVLVELSKPTSPGAETSYP